MAENAFDPGQPVPYFVYARSNSQAKRSRVKYEKLKSQLEVVQQQKAKSDELLQKLAASYKEMKADPRLQITEEQFNQYQTTFQQTAWQQQEEQFKGALDGLLAEGVTPGQLLKAVGYDPNRVDSLTPEILQDVINTAYEEFPFMFQRVTEPDPSQGQPNSQAEPDDSVPGQMMKAFTDGSVVQQPSRELFTQPLSQPQGQSVTNQMQPRPMPQPQQPQGQHLPQPQPQMQFRGYGDLQGRGGPAPTRPSTIQARLRDPAWLAQNQGALAQAVANGVSVTSSDQ